MIDSETGGTGTELNDVLETIDLQAFVDPVSLKAHFWDMFVVDAFLGNFDRHNGNWGFLVDPVTNKAEIAPAFDFGSCLLPQADDEIMRRVIEDKAERDARIYNFPASALKENGKKIGYVDFFRRHAGDLLAPSLARIARRIDLAALCAFIDGVPFLSDLQRTFYKVYLAARYEALFVQQKVGDHPYFGSAVPTGRTVTEEVDALRHGGGCLCVPGLVPLGADGLRHGREHLRELPGRLRAGVPLRDDFCSA